MPFRDWPAALVWPAALLTVLLLADAIRRADWRDEWQAGHASGVPPGTAGEARMTGDARTTSALDWLGAMSPRLFWALATFGVLALRQMTVHLPGGLTLQYLGAAWLALLLGYPRAVVSMAAIYLVEFAVSGISGSGLAAASVGQRVASLVLPLLLLAIGPAWLAWSIARGCRRWLPANLFVFLIGVGFIGLQIAYGLPMLLAAALGAVIGGPLGPGFWQDVLPFALLLVAGEAWLEGFLVTMLVVYAPNRVRLYDDKHYLPP